MRRKCVSMLLAIVMVLAMLPGTALAEEEEVITYPVTGGNIYIKYNAEEDYCYIWDCDDSVTEADIPSEVEGHIVKRIRQEAFANCPELTSVSLPDSLTFIADWAFENCTALTSITIPAAVELDRNPFTGCDNLKEIKVAADNPNYVVENGAIFSKDKISLISYPSASGAYNVPDGVEEIGDSAFEQCTGITSVTLPDSLTSIGYYAFAECRNLTSVTLPDSLTSIGDCAFFECSELTGVTLPHSLTSIDQAVFSYCDNLTSVTIPASVTTIGSGAFLGCDSLKDVYYAGTEAQWKAIEIDHSGESGDHNAPLADATIHYNSTGPEAADKPSTPDTPSTPSTTAPSFTDVKPSAYYAAPVAWAVEQEITSGTGNNQFSPGRTCNVSEILTFLWRAAGKPEPTVENPFTDVKESNFYYKPALWAYEKGMVTGSTFNPSAVCTRAMAVTFIWQASDSPAADAASFTDVPTDSSYAAAVAWAVANGVTEGVGNGQFNPTGTCTRGQIVTFLYRAFAE